MNSIIVWGLKSLPKWIFPQFCCLKKDCPGYKMKNQENIALKERYGKITMHFLNVKPASVVLVKPEVQHFLDSTLPRKKF
jgi:hypothetical protein